MSRYLILLGAAIIVFGIAAGSIEISNSYNEYQSHLHVSGDPSSSPLTMLDDARWQAARLIGGGVIFGSVIAGSILMGLGWIGKTMEQIRDLLAHQTAQPVSQTSAAKS